ncbi:MAG: hypothetical protein EU533_02415, partial [Promethearchaeota archaeon]
LACIIGKKFGSHSLWKNTQKTIEGFIAGAGSTFIIVTVIMIIYEPWINLNLLQIIIMALVAAIMFMIVDLFIEQISDNIMNPLLTGLAMWVILILF